MVNTGGSLSLERLYFDSVMAATGLSKVGDLLKSTHAYGFSYPVRNYIIKRGSLFFALQLNLRVTGIWHTDIINLHVFRVITLLENKAIRVDLLHGTMMFDTKATTHQSWARGDCLDRDINRYNQYGINCL